MTATAGQRISITNLSKRYGARTVLDQVSLQIEPGETVALIGPSCGGKSTLLRCLNRLETPDSGSVVVDGIDMMDRRTDLDAARRRVGAIVGTGGVWRSACGGRLLQCTKFLPRRRNFTRRRLFHRRTHSDRPVSFLSTPGNRRDFSPRE